MSGMAAAYRGTATRTFEQAVVHLLETQYGVLGSRRVLNLLAADVQALATQFYPPAEHLAAGWLVFTGTKATGAKAYPGQTAADQELVTLAWPVIVPADLQTWATMPPGAAGQQVRRALLRTRLVRLIEHGWTHPLGPVLLTQADLAVMLNLTPPQVSPLLAAARAATGRPLVTKGYYFDQGRGPSHKVDVITAYEAGLDEATVADTTHHHPSSVGRYLRDYERVKLLLPQHSDLGYLAFLVGRQPSVVQVYVELVKKFHPELLVDPAPEAAP